MKKIIQTIVFLLLFSILSFSSMAMKDIAVYVCDTGSDRNEGTSSLSPFKTLATAYDFVSNGGTVVVCGPLTLTGDALKFPHSSGKVTITSKYDGTDFSKENGAVINLGGYTYLNGDTEFADIKLHDSSSFYFNQLVCQGNSLTIGENVTCTRASGEYITILGGQYINSNLMKAEDVSFYDYTITVNSGLWYGINGSNKRTSSESAMGATGNVKIVINGGSFTGKTANQADAIISVGGYASQDGDYYIEINGGIFNSPIVAIARPGNNSGRYTAYYEGDVYVKITGGEFRGDRIATVQSDMASYIGGNYTLEVEDGKFTALKSVSADRVRGTSACIVPSEIQNQVVGFDTVGNISENITKERFPDIKSEAGVVFVGGRAEGDGKSSVSPLNSLEKAIDFLGENGGTVVVCKPIRVKNAYLPKTNGKVVFTSVYGGKDFREISNADIELTGTITLGGETLFENVDFEARSLAAYIFCGFNKTVFGDGIRCKKHMDGGVTEYVGIFTGDRLVKNSDKALGQKTTDITIKSGEWRFLRSGNERAEGGAQTLRTVTGDSVINIFGGTFHEDVCGTGKNNHNGDISLNISGGTFLCSIFGMATPANIDKDISVVNGNININISGGEFHGDIAPVQNYDKNSINGVYSLSITDGNLGAVGTIKGTEGVLGKNTSKLVSELDFTAEVVGEITFDNPILGTGADPSVYYHKGWYYYVRPTTLGSAQAIQISRSTNISDIGNTMTKIVFIGDSELKSIWASQIYFLDGSWYIYFSGCSSSSTLVARRPYVLKSDSEDPLGNYSYVGTLDNLDSSIFSWLSPRIFEYGGTRYYISSVFVDESDNTTSKHTQTMVIGKLSSPTSFEGSVSAISTPDKSWEAYDIMEGPFPVYGEDGNLYIAYAANYADGEDYCTGLLKLVGEDLMKAESWQKQLRPMQQRDDKNLIFAPGATVFAPSPFGEEVFAVYHVKLHANNGYNRSIFVQKLSFKDGVPYLGAPPEVGQTITYKLNPMPISERIFGFDKESKFKAIRNYLDVFSDVKKAHWFYEYVKTAYEFELVNGTSPTKFSPDSKFTVAQALTAAANIHSVYSGNTIGNTSSGGAWYNCYVQYCVTNGIIEEGQFENFDKNITRGEMATVFAHILPDSEYETVRKLSNPDVTSDMECYDAVQKLVNAGIVSGDASSGNYRPYDEIVRSEACVIFTRIAAKEFRAK